MVLPGPTRQLGRRSRTTAVGGCCHRPPAFVLLMTWIYLRRQRSLWNRVSIRESTPVGARTAQRARSITRGSSTSFASRTISTVRKQLGLLDRLSPRSAATCSESPAAPRSGQGACCRRNRLKSGEFPILTQIERCNCKWRICLGRCSHRWPAQLLDDDLDRGTQRPESDEDERPHRWGGGQH